MQSSLTKSSENLIYKNPKTDSNDCENLKKSNKTTRLPIKNSTIEKKMNMSGEMNKGINAKSNRVYNM